ncbi:MAG: PLP-dependent transferase [Solirubrobacteraceae bacterium]|nr:PLP-dependent transferase [Solirubrobacteraceae bacterium]
MAFKLPPNSFGIPAAASAEDLGAPERLLRAERMAAVAWGARRTWFLTGGATQGNVAACLAIAQGGTDVVVQRTAHGSTIDGLIAAGLAPTFVAPEVDERLGISHCVTPQALDRALNATPGAAAAFVVSPTFYGAVADVRGLARVAHGHGAPLIVDETWGAHLPFSDRLPAPALAAGADLVITSPQKHLGSLAGSALLHLGRHAGEWLDEEGIARALGALSSTRPSRVLCASLDEARQRAVRDGPALLYGMVHALADLRREITAIPGLDVQDERIVGQHGVVGFDPLRLTIDVRGSGAGGDAWLGALRRASDVEPAVCEEHVLVVAFELGDDVAAWGERLLTGLHGAHALLGRRPGRAAPAPVLETAPLARLTPRDAFLAGREEVPVQDAVGRIAAESLIPTPPGIPLVLPGEELDATVLLHALRAVRRGTEVRGAADPELRTVLVVVEPVESPGAGPTGAAEVRTGAPRRPT